MLEKIAISSNEHTTFERAALTCLSLICEYTDSELGHVCFKSFDSNGEYQLRHIWLTSDDPRYDEFKNATSELAAQSTWEFYESLMKARSPFWLTNITNEPGFRRKQAALNTGLNSMFAFPVDIQGETMAFVEFLRSEEAVPDEMLVDVLETIGGLIGRVLEREIFPERVAIVPREVSEGQ